MKYVGPIGRVLLQKYSLSECCNAMNTIARTRVHNIYLLFITVVRCSRTESLIVDAFGGYYKSNTRQDGPYMFGQYKTAVSTNPPLYYFKPYVVTFFCKGLSTSAFLSPEKHCNYKLSEPRQN